MNRLVAPCGTQKVSISPLSSVSFAWSLVRPQISPSFSRDPGSPCAEAIARVHIQHIYGDVQAQAPQQN